MRPPLSASECHDPVRLPGLAAVFGERLLPPSDVDLWSRPQKATQHRLAPHALFAVELADATEKSSGHWGKEGPRVPRIRPVDRPLGGRRIEQTHGDAFEGCTVTDRAITIEMPETAEKRCDVGGRLEFSPFGGVSQPFFQVAVLNLPGSEDKVEVVLGRTRG